MDLDFTSEQDMLRRSARGLCERLFPLATVRRLERERAGHSPEFWAALAEGGFLALRIAEADGGAGLGCLDAIIVAEELGRALVMSSYLDSAVLAARLIALAGTKTQRGIWLPRIAEGAIIAPAWFEAGEAFPGSTTARRSGDGLIVSGGKCLVPFVASAHRLAVLARHPEIDGELVIALVDPTAPEVSVVPQSNHASFPLAKVSFADVAVPADQCIGLTCGIRKAWDRAFTEMLVAVAAEAVGGAERALEITVAYAKERKQFDRPIGGFQAIAHALADRAVEIEGAKGLVYQAAWTLDQGLDAMRLASIAKLEACAAFRRMGAAAVQTHGGLGFTREGDAQLYFRRAKHLQLMYGDPTWLEDRIADEILGVGEGT